MLIPSLDLMGGKIVQLVQGKKKALEFDDPEEWIARFTTFPLVQLIDLDAAMGTGENAVLMARFLNHLPCQVGGGIRSTAAARTLLAAGAHRVILGSALIDDGRINVSAAREFTDQFSPDKLVFAIDSRAGRVAIRGWKELTDVTPQQMIQELEPFCTAFLYTNIETEGSMAGIPLAPVREMRRATSRQLIAAGGISTQQEIDDLHSMRVDAVVGMAIYTNLLKLPYNIPAS